MSAPRIPDYVTPEYLNELRDRLKQGAGSGALGDRCSIQEVRAWLDLDPSTDGCPDCVCPVLHKLVIITQDRRLAWRREIALLLPQLVGSRGSADLTQRRAYRCADWAIRTVTPFALDAAVKALKAARIPRHPAILAEHAAKLRALNEITGNADADAAAAAAAAAAADADAPSPVDLIRELLKMHDPTFLTHARR